MPAFVRLATALALSLAVSAPSVAGMPADRYAAMDGRDALRARADGILARLVAAVPPEAAARRVGWQVQVVDLGLHDAEAFAGGEIRLSARFVERLALNDAELAMLLAHEVAHVVRGDARAQARGAGDRPRAGGGDDARSRQHELDADALGLALATAAGWEPTALRHFYRKVRDALGDVGNATHPSVSIRLKRLEAPASRPRD